jgi:hypothetical protein
MPESEVTAPVPALDELGRPQNFGWARSSCFLYDPDLLRTARRKVSESDRYVLFSSTHLVVFEIMDDGYLGYLLISVVSLKDKKRTSQAFVTPFSLGSFELPKDSNAGSIRYNQRKNRLTFSAMEGGARIIKADISRFGRHRSLRGEVVLTLPEGAESLVTHMPWRGRGGAFYYTRRSPWYSAEGVIQIGSSEIFFSRGSGWGIFDWNRGVRPPSDLRFWASGCGLAEGRQIGFTVGYNSADSSLGTENAFFLDGRLHKLDQVTFHIPSAKPAPWRFTSNDNRLEMVFSPHQERDEKHQMFFYSLKRRQLFGSFSGRVVLDGGSELTFRDITGFYERRKSRL